MNDKQNKSLLLLNKICHDLEVMKGEVCNGKELNLIIWSKVGDDFPASGAFGNSNMLLKAIARTIFILADQMEEPLKDVREIIDFYLDAMAKRGEEFNEEN